jgi:hypothetical protein
MAFYIVVSVILLFGLGLLIKAKRDSTLSVFR